MRVLVTGATGFIGRALCDSLAAGGHEAVALSRDPDRARAGVPSIHSAYGWNLSRDPAPAAAFEGVDAIVHLAGESVVGLWTAAKRRAIVESRVAGVRNLLRGLEAAAHRPRIWIGASAVGYYGDRGEEALDESSAPGVGFLAETCLAWETETRRAAEAGLRTTILRIGVVLERDGGALGAMLAPFKLGLGGPLGSGRQWWSWIHRDDLIGLVRLLLDRPAAPEVVNAVAPEPVRQRDFARTLGRVLRRPAVLPAPAFALRALLGGFSDELLSSKRVYPRAAEALGYRFLRADLEAALRESLR